jgi:hypothetical protein
MAENPNEIKLNPPNIIPFGDGDFTGSFGPVTGHRPPGTVRGYSPDRYFWGVPAITPLVGERHPATPATNKRILYVNGIGTPMSAHAYTVKLLSVVSGAAVMGVYNQSGDGVEPNYFYDLVQCLGDKTGLSNNPATKTLASAIYDSCVSGVYLNIVAHSQGAIITSRALRQGIGLLLDRYGRMNEKVRALFAEIEKRRGFWENVGRGIIGADDVDRLKLEIALRREILPLIEKRLNDFVSVQTFGGAGRFFPDGPLYRHVSNFWDPVSNAFGQTGYRLYPAPTGSGRGGVVEEIDRNAGMRIRDFADHSMDGVYLQSSEYFVDRSGKKVDSSYIPIHMNMVR